VCSAAEMVKSRGAKNIYITATHGVLAGEALERISKAPIDELVVTDSIPLNEETKKIKSIKVLTIATMLAEAIKRIHRNESVSNLFTHY
ncbi:MAG: phosphoribosylpyrophosphate synthetase, partial [Planctomycetota bacterium]